MTTINLFCPVGGDSCFQFSKLDTTDEAELLFWFLVPSLFARIASVFLNIIQG